MIFTIHCVLFCLVAKSSGHKVPFIDDNEFSLKRESSTGFGVILMPDKENDIVNQSLQALQTASATLLKHGTNIAVLDCKVSQSEFCTNYATEILLFRNGRMVADLPSDKITTQNEAEGKILHLLHNEAITHIEDESSWDALTRKCDGKCNIVITYMDGLGSQFHNFIIQSALQWANKTQFAYITDYELAIKLMPHENKVDRSAAVWISLCNGGFIDGNCPLTELQDWDQNVLKDIFESMWDRPLVNVIGENEKATDIYKYAERFHEEGSEVFLFVASKGKLQRAKLLAMQTCANYFLTAECILANGDLKNGFSSKVVKDYRIHLTIIPKGANARASEGFLVTESIKEVKEKFMLASSINNDSENTEEEGNESEEGPSKEENEKDTREEKEVQTMQDDPVVFSIHTSRKLVDLYLYDFKTLSRLTDVSYPQIINSSEYAVVLFTLEFNPKSLAALSNFANIHEDFKRKNLKSPLHVVECFNWPDVCKKEAINTYPRMFFYRQNEARSAQEYRGMWAESEMAKTITLYSMPWPIPGLQHEVLKSIPEDSDMVIGIVDTIKGEEEFKKAARIYGSQALFLMVKGDDAKTIAEADDITDWKEKNHILRSVNGKQMAHVTFNDLSDIKQYLDSPVAQWRELTISNFESMLNSDKPLVIQFVNQSSPELNQQTSLSKKLEGMALKNKLSSSVVLTWMDSSPGTAGEYALYMYSGGKSDPLPIAFVDKKRNVVNMMSASKVPSKHDIKAWIKSCLSGKEEITFTFRDDVWGPRIPGYDYLQMMKKEGTYPVAGQQVVKEMKEPPKKSARLHAHVHHPTPSRSNPPPRHTEL